MAKNGKVPPCLCLSPGSELTSGEQHSHVQGRYRHPHNWPHAPQQRPVVVRQDLEVPRVPAARGAPRRRKPELLAASSGAGVDGALLNLKINDKDMVSMQHKVY